MPQQRDHLAVVHRRYLDLILEGRKTVESRLTRVRCEPFGKIDIGDRVYFKEQSGPIRAVATVGALRSHEGLTPGAIRRLRVEHNDQILGGRDYWALKRDARYAVLIWLSDVAQTEDWTVRPRLNGRGWLCLDGGAVRDRIESCSISTH